MFYALPGSIVLLCATGTQTHSFPAQAPCTGRCDTDTAKLCEVSPPPASTIVSSELPITKRCFWRKTEFIPATWAPWHGCFRSYGNYDTPWSCGSGTAPGALGYTLHIAQLLQLESALVLSCKEGQCTPFTLSPTLPKSFRSHLTPHLCHYELPALSVSSLGLEDFAFTGRAWWFPNEPPGALTLQEEVLCRFICPAEMLHQAP